MKEKFNLQLFGEGEPSGEPNNTKEPNGEPNTEPKTFTQDEVDAIIQKRLAKEQKKANEDAEKKVKEALEKQAKKNEAEKFAQMNDEEKRKAEFEQMRAELEEMKSKNALSEMATQARNILAEKEVSIPDSLVEMLVTKDAETTNKRVDAFVELFKSAVAEEVKNNYKSATPRTGSASKITKEEILSIKDDVERQAKIAENIHLFK